MEFTVAVILVKIGERKMNREEFEKIKQFIENKRKQTVPEFMAAQIIDDAYPEAKKAWFDVASRIVYQLAVNGVSFEDLRMCLAMESGQKIFKENIDAIIKSKKKNIDVTYEDLVDLMCVECQLAS